MDLMNLKNESTRLQDICDVPCIQINALSPSRTVPKTVGRRTDGVTRLRRIQGWVVVDDGWGARVRVNRMRGNDGVDTLDAHRTVSPHAVTGL